MNANLVSRKPTNKPPRKLSPAAIAHNSEFVAKKYPNFGPAPQGLNKKNSGRKKMLPEIDVLLAEVLGEENSEKISAAKAILMRLRKSAIKDDDNHAAQILLDRAYGRAALPIMPIPGVEKTIGIVIELLPEPENQEKEIADEEKKINDEAKKRIS